MALSGLKLNSTLVTYLREVAERVESGELRPELPVLVKAPKRKIRDRLTDQQIDSMIESYLAGATVRELATGFAICQTSVKPILRRRDVRKRGGHRRGT